MNRQLNPKTASDEQRLVVLIDEPDECPLCHRHLVPKFIGVVACSAEVYGDVDAAFQCSSRECQHLFIARYVHSDSNSPARFRLLSTAPVNARPPAVPDNVAALSPAFVEVYTQAIAAEGAGLDQLTGIGLRKALEFLVKDFAVTLFPDKTDVIRKTPLGKCIKDFVEDANLKKTATRAAWLGNDETHYVRTWEDKDISDLKVLIRLTMNWADNVLLTNQYTDEMPG